MVDPIAHNLPLQLSSFIGREREIVEIMRLLDPSGLENPKGLASRLITLTGTGGCGKTRLALQVAMELVGASLADAQLGEGEPRPYADGVWFVALAALSDPALVAQQVATTLGVREQTGQALLATLTNYLREKELLLLLDNCEHLLEACTQLAQTLLQACPQLTILATSREALNVAGEQMYRVPSLQIPTSNFPLPTSRFQFPTSQTSIIELAQNESVRLFVARAQAAQAHFALNEKNAAAVAQICQRLDGIPLAIELAAARVRVLSVQQIAARLDDALQLLTRGSAPSLRQQTMRAALDWSHELLSESERVLFRRLAVFAGSWDLEATEQVCTVNGHPPLRRVDVLDVLTSLVEQSLVLVIEQEEMARYRLLEPIRQYARSKLDEAGEAQSFMRRHLEFFVRFAMDAAPQLHRVQQRQWYRHLDTDYHNLRAAIEWGVTNQLPLEGLRLTNALGWYWFFRGQWREGFDHTTKLLATLEHSTLPTLRERELIHADSLAMSGWLAVWLGQLAQAQSLLTESIARARTLDKEGGRVLSLALGHLAFITSQGIDLAKAQSAATENVQVARNLSDPWLIARAQNILSWVLMREHIQTNQGDFQLARHLAEDSLRLWRSLGDQLISGRALGQLGTISFLQGDYAAARVYAEEEIRLVQELDDRGTLAFALNRLALIAQRQEYYTEAEQLFKQSLELCRTMGGWRDEAENLRRLGDVARAQNHWTEALTYYLESLSLSRDLMDDGRLLTCMIALASVATAQKQTEYAVHWLAQVEVIMGKAVQTPDIPHGDAQQLATLRAQFTSKVFAQAWREACTLTLDQVIAETEQLLKSSSATTEEKYPADLTEREVEVLRWVARGLTNQEIADQLVVSRRTIHAHLRSIFSKLDVTTRAAATHAAMELKLV